MPKPGLTPWDKRLKRFQQHAIAMGTEDKFPRDEWRKLVEALTIIGSVRKLRLFAVACCRRIEPALFHAAAWRALIIAERLADSDVEDEEVNQTRRWLMEVAINTNTYTPHEFAAHAPLCCLNHSATSAVEEAIVVAWKTSQPWRPLVWSNETIARLNDIFGNPFRPVAFDPAWRTSTVHALASQMYDSRDFTPMPILADALQDAGCEHHDILAHCRGPGPHVRGCWVVDLVLGKS